MDGHVGPDNPVCLIETFADELDLAGAGLAGVAPKATERPGYDPAAPLKLRIHGCLNRVRSGWRLEAGTRRNVE